MQIQALAFLLQPHRLSNHGPAILGRSLAGANSHRLFT
jgi:hypothetical protein